MLSHQLWKNSDFVTNQSLLIRIVKVELCWKMCKSFIRNDLKSLYAKTLLIGLGKVLFYGGVGT